MSHGPPEQLHAVYSKTDQARVTLSPTLHDRALKHKMPLNVEACRLHRWHKRWARGSPIIAGPTRLATSGSHSETQQCTHAASTERPHQEIGAMMLHVRVTNCSISEPRAAVSLDRGTQQSRLGGVSRLWGVITTPEKRCVSCDLHFFGSRCFKGQDVTCE